ncbi:restriction endonuclease subunit S [Stutzerimonas stutzeri]|uniref:restriction endonuclease subunit S n=1 Tax=Stutzerimonas stutzeri TaxID=316 RepID=UPI000F7AB76B|nr:restriction endonuclease subunit S [Stutzerimonas stutzeri]RRV89493.1 restriction endonuclease subunit S [Stutzerimonas stutzeri]
MTALLTDNLSLLAGAPNGIKKLRELILELAVRGKLVPQDPSDEPASELLNLLITEARDTTGRGKAKRQALPEVCESEQPYILPNGWAWGRLGDVTEILDSLRRPVTKQDRKPGPYPYYGASGVVDYVSAYIFDEPLVLVGEDGAKWGVGERTAFSITGKTWVNNHAHVLRPKRDAVCDDYLVISLTAQDLSQFITGMTVPKLNQARLTSIGIPLPPLAEQHRIVAKVDELMALCDRLEAQQADAESAHALLVQALLHSLTQAADAEDFAASWQRLAENFHTLFTTESSIDALKQTLLQLAVMGKLVPQDPNDEPASELLKRIAKEKARLVAEGKLKKQKPLAEIDESEMSFEPPSGWKWQRFAEFALDVSTGPFGSLIHQSDYVDGGVPLVNPSHMVDGRIVADSSVSLLPERAVSLDSYRLSAGDIVMARRGEVGRAALVTEAEEGWLCGTGSFVLRFTSEISRAYVWILFRCHSVRTYLAGAAVGTTMVNLNHGILLKMPIAVPPIIEQHRIVAKVDQLMALCDQLKTRLTQARQLNERLATALVEQAVA